jgi:hypothetical protein
MLAMRHAKLFAIAFGLSMLTTVACNNEGKFCDKMKSLYGEEMNDCETDALPEIKKQCKDPNAVFDCIAAAGDKEAADKCRDKCEPKEDK